MKDNTSMSIKTTVQQTPKPLTSAELQDVINELTDIFISVSSHPETPVKHKARIAARLPEREPKQSTGRYSRTILLDVLGRYNHIAFAPSPESNADAARLRELVERLFEVQSATTQREWMKMAAREAIATACNAARVLTDGGPDIDRPLRVMQYQKPTVSMVEDFVVKADILLAKTRGRKSDNPTVRHAVSQLAFARDTLWWAAGNTKS